MIDIHGSKILIADDVPENIQVLAGAIRDEGFKISFAMNGKQAVSTAKSLKPDLILMDVNMPEMNGFEATKAIKADPELESIPIIFLTALNDHEDILRGFNSGGSDYVPKPFNSTELISRIKIHLMLKKSIELVQEQNKSLKRSQELILEESRKILELNTRLSDSEEKLSYLNASKDKFFSIIAHDLRNPMGGIMSLVSTIIDYFNQMSPAEVLDLVKTLKTAAQQTYSLLENLLEWSRAQTGRIEYYPDYSDFSETVSKTLNLIKTNAVNKEININVEHRADTWAYYDSNLIDTTLRNLVTNAIKFSPRGGKISVISDIRGESLEVRVIDSGVGMPIEVINGLFRIDISHKSSGTEGEKGTGLGLILCKEFVELNGGKIKIESEQNKGTTVTFTLPLGDGLF